MSTYSTQKNNTEFSLFALFSLFCIFLIEREFNDQISSKPLSKTLLPKTQKLYKGKSVKILTFLLLCVFPVARTDPGGTGQVLRVGQKGKTTAHAALPNVVC